MLVHTNYAFLFTFVSFICENWNTRIKKTTDIDLEEREINVSLSLEKYLKITPLGAWIFTVGLCY